MPVYAEPTNIDFFFLISIANGNYHYTNLCFTGSLDIYFSYSNISLGKLHVQCILANYGKINIIILYYSHVTCAGRQSDTSVSQIIIILL